jgi:hypothetical protein
MGLIDCSDDRKHAGFDIILVSNLLDAKEKVFTDFKSCYNNFFKWERTRTHL